jgi:hypothetical protein
LSTNIIIDGPGSSVLTLAGSSAPGTPWFRIFNVSAGGVVTISGLTITGVGIANSGTLSVTGSTLSGNSALEGGGIFNSGTLTVTSSTFSGNSAEWGLASCCSGGGIFNSGTLTITGSTLSGNAAAGSLGPHGFGGAGTGGGIFNSGTLMVTGSTLSGNTVAGSGGGIFNSGILTVTGSTFSGNATNGVGSLGGTYPGEGGGIANSGTLSLTNVTLRGNTVSGSGGGIFNSGTLMVTGSTLSDNAANGVGTTGNGGGISISTWPNTEVASIDSIFENPQGGNVSGGSAGNFHSQGHNLFSDTPAAALDPTDLVNTNPLLGPLADNGGPTLTQALLPGSLAIGAGVSVPGVTTDQRGVPRPQRAPDIGAFESPYLPPTVMNLQPLGVRARPPSIVVTFSSAMDVVRAESLTNYRLASAEPDRRHGTRDGRAIRSARYDATSKSVTLRLRRRLPLNSAFRLTIIGTPPGGLTSASGVFLDGADTGRAGSDYVAIVSLKSLANEAGRHKAPR